MDVRLCIFDMILLASAWTVGDRFNHKKKIYDIIGEDELRGQLQELQGGEGPCTKPFF